MMEASNYRVRWNDHHPFLIELLHNLQVRESFVDVTLAAEGRFIRVHRLILGACSHYFEEMLCTEPGKQAIIFLKDVRYDDLRAVVDFIYKGEVSVPHEQLETFLCTAKALKIKGLEMSEKSQKGDGPAVDEVQLDDKTPAAAVASTPLTTPSTTPLTTPSTTPSTVKSAAGGRRTRPNGGGGGSGGVSRFKDKNKRSASKTPQRASVPAHTASAGVVQLASDQASDSHEVMQIDTDMEIDPLLDKLDAAPPPPPKAARRDDDIIALPSFPGPAVSESKAVNAKPPPAAVRDEPPLETAAAAGVAGADPRDADAASPRRQAITFTCTLCPFTSTTNFNLKMHVKRKHQNGTV